MRFITRDHIENWAKTSLSKGQMPELISKLVRATTPLSTISDFPAGSATTIGGWDGVVQCEDDTPYIPSGTSLFEFGTEARPKGKADKDYAKRTKNPDGYSLKDSVFIFITPRFWKGKATWTQSKRKEGIWKDVRAYDSSDLEQWLELTMATARWFSKQPGINAYPFDGIMTVEEFWEEWSIGPNYQLLPEVVTAGRHQEIQQLMTILQGPAVIKGVKASTKNEAIAFIIAAAKCFPSPDPTGFFSKSLIVDTEGNYRGIHINSALPLNLIPRFDEVQPLYAAVSRGHHVLVPLGADNDFNQDTIMLPKIDKDGQVNSLVKIGMSTDNAEKFSRESGRNITILKKLIGFPSSKAKWNSNEDITEIIPALLLGRWDQTFTGDVELIEYFSNAKYSEYLSILNKWKNFEESPLIQIGETWRLTSPLDLWTNISSRLDGNSLEKLKNSVLKIFIGGNPEEQRPENTPIYFSLKKKYSAWSLEGLIQSLILVARYGRSLSIQSIKDTQSWVDEIVCELLLNAPGDRWVSVNRQLPLISEASPQSFLEAVKNSLSKVDPEIMEMFREFENFLHKDSHHTGLLWALEGLAWMPQYLMDVSLILLKLSRLDPGGQLSNRPFNSIVEIYKPWHYQTLTPFGDRMEILEHVSEIETESGWKLLIRMLPETHAIAHSTHKMRWRIFDENTNLNYTYQESWSTYSKVLKLLLKLCNNSEKRFSQLIEVVEDVGEDDREILMSWIETHYESIDIKEYRPWHTLRKLLHRHRSNKDTDWALPEGILIRLQKIYTELTPVGIVDRYLWLFNDSWPESPEGFEYSDEHFERSHEVRGAQIVSARIEAASAFLKFFGVKGTVELAKQVQEPSQLGDVLARIINSEDEVLEILSCFNADVTTIQFFQSFFLRKFVIEGFGWIKGLIQKLQSRDVDEELLINLLLPIEQSKRVWDLVSTQSSSIQIKYWEKVIPLFFDLPLEDKIYGLQKLMEFGRYFSAFHILCLNPENIPTNFIAELLTKAVTTESSEPVNIREYEVERIFAVLGERGDLPRSKLANIEWLYIPFLDSNRTRHTPRALEEELAQNPTFFVDVLKLLYTPNDKSKIEEERRGLSDEIIKNRAIQAYHLLHSWRKIPGMKSDNSIDIIELRKWIDEARSIAEKSDRLEVADMTIGTLLAQYPEDIPDWPQEVIFQVIEEINTKSLKNNYYSALYNKRGSTTRSPFEGGTIERKNAMYFSELHKRFRVKYPNVAQIFADLSAGYLKEAKREDDEAERNRLEY